MDAGCRNLTVQLLMPVSSLLSNSAAGRRGVYADYVVVYTHVFKRLALGGVSGNSRLGVLSRTHMHTDASTKNGQAVIGEEGKL